MIPLISFFIILLISLTIVRIAAVVLKMTGLSEDIARFQAYSAYTGTGFTTRESESIIKHPVRRKVIQNVMILGNIGIVSFISSLLLTFTTGESGDDLLIRLGILLGGALALFLLFRTKAFNWLISALTKGLLRKKTHLYTKDYDSLLLLSGEFEVVRMKVSVDGWLSGKTLAEMALPDEGILVIGVHRSDGYYTGTPKGSTAVFGQDELILYGRDAALRDLGTRPSGLAGDEIHRLNAARMLETSGRLPESNKEKLTGIKNLIGRFKKEGSNRSQRKK